MGHNKRAEAEEEKVWIYINSLVLDEKFAKAVSDFRQKYKIPTGGHQKVLERDGENGKVVLIPEHLNGSDFFSETNSWVESLGLDSNVWGEEFRYFLAYGKWFHFDNHGMNSLIDIMDLHDFTTPQFLYEDDDGTEIHDVMFSSEHLKNIADIRPVFISISPYARKTDIIDAVNEKYESDIKPIQDAHKNNSIRLGKSYKINQEKFERDQFIYENRDLEIEKLVSLTHEKYGQLMERSQIYKIIRKFSSLMKHYFGQ